MNDQNRQEKARKIFDGLLKAKVREPLTLADLDIGNPRFVAAFHALDNNKNFWRVPILSRSFGRLVGFFDVRDFNEPIELLRASPLPRRKLSTQEGIATLPRDVCEMTEENVRFQAQSFAGAVRVLGVPQLVFQQVETKVAWKVSATRDGDAVTILVTPECAFDPSD